MGARRGLRLLALAPLLVAAGLLADAQPARAELREIYATQGGEPAYDHDPFGGNPFASALIAALAEGEEEPMERLVTDTIANSGGLQFPDLSRGGEGAVLVPDEGERAVALVAVFADYGDENGLVSLPGAAFDAIRVGRALAAAGYEVRTLVAVDAQAFREAVSSFSRQADDATRALLYITGHGVEERDVVWLMPPEAESAGNMLLASIPMTEIRTRFAGPGERLLIYAGCRDNPMELTPLGPAQRIRTP